MFEVSDLVLISKVDTLPYFDFDKQKLEQNVHLRNPNAKIIYLSAKTGEGMDEWLDWLRDAVRDWKA